MQAGEALGVTAQVAVTLAGFAGIVVVFRPQAVHEWSALDRFRLNLLLTNSALPLAYALLGMLLLSIEPPVPALWRWCSGAAFLTQMLIIVAARNPTRRIPAAHLRSVNRLLFYGIGLLGAAAMALQVINVAVWGRFWPFFTIIFVHLIAGLIQFLRLLLLPPHEER